MPEDRDATLAALLRYQALRPAFASLAWYLQQRLRAIAARLDRYPIVSGRAKSLESFLEKMHGRGYADPLGQMGDLCGVRVIVHTLGDVDLFAEAVQAEFALDQARSEDRQRRLAWREFGYLSRHFTLRLDALPPVTGFPDAERAALEELRQSLAAQGIELVAELQLRTLAQHVWADAYHELGYKNEFQLPPRWEREFARLAALLEQCDRGLQAIRDAMATYESGYGAYLEEAQLRALASRLEALLEVKPDSPGAVHRLIRCYLALPDGTRRILGLLAVHGERLAAHPPALRDVGVAYCQVHSPGSPEFARGQELLRRAVVADPRDVDALASLAGALRRQARREDAEGRGEAARELRLSARDHYRQAHYLDPTNPYPLANYIAEELLSGADPRVIDYFRSSIEAAVQRCRQQVAASVNLPWALFDLGVFHLHLGRPHEGLGYYARGLAGRAKAWMARTARESVAEFAARGVALPGLELVDRLLRLGCYVAEPEHAGCPPPVSPVALASPVLILAGGCEGLAEVHRRQLAQLVEALGSFRGTLLSGGTRSGIAAVAGDLQERIGGGLRTVGYLPRLEVPELDARYAVHRATGGADYSPLEALVYWEDLLGAGLDPRRVLLLGFNGGRIAACEYRIALALGARVGIVRGSGRAADELLDDPLWRGYPDLVPLDVPGDAVAAFLAGRDPLRG